MKWIICPGCDKGYVVHDSARSCSHKCRSRVWRRRHGVVARRATICAWCGAPLVYMPQERLPGIRQYCDDQCAGQARLFTKARERMTVVKALNTAVRRLSTSRMPVTVAATNVLAELRDQLVETADTERSARIAAFLSKLPPVA